MSLGLKMMLKWRRRTTMVSMMTKPRPYLFLCVCLFVNMEKKEMEKKERRNFHG
jgi:hypothetical protein